MYWRTYRPRFSLACGFNTACQEENNDKLRIRILTTSEPCSSSMFRKTFQESCELRQQNMRLLR